MTNIIIIFGILFLSGLLLCLAIYLNIKMKSIRHTLEIEVYNDARRIIDTYKDLIKYNDNLYKFNITTDDYSPNLEPFVKFNALGHKNVSFESSFLRYTRYWLDRPTIDASYYSLETLRLLGNQEMFSQEKVGSYFKFFNKCYIERSGFSIYPNDSYPSIYASNCAVNLLKNIFNKKCGDTLGREKVELYFSEKLEGIIKFINGCKTQGIPLLKDNSKKGAVPTINILYTAQHIFWVLEKQEVFNNEIIKFNDIVNYVLEQFEETEFYGFPVNPMSDVTAMCSTRFALKLLSNIHVNQDYLKKFEYKERIKKFVMSCQHKDGGFSATRGENSSLNATMFALEILNMLGFISNKEITTSTLNLAPEKILEFVKRCKSKDGGFGFFEGSIPNVYAYRNALQILEYFGDIGKKKQLEWCSDLEKSIINKFYEPDVGGFWGYPKYK